ncbi:zf-CCHC domain-containing protein [Tanacetum coccineum]|uniref:Zf-CCHC domain-containing protein n=1 Tax=Tanacetum coccineum TaxID=301880 RepID=A0ABQ5B879_9ASTR
MAQENYVNGCSMQRPPLLEANGFCFWKTRFEAYVKSKYIDLWKVIQEDDEKRKLGKNNEANMTLYNTPPRKEYERVFMCETAKEKWDTLIITHKGNSQVKDCKIDLLSQHYEKFLISSEETIHSDFTWFNSIFDICKEKTKDGESSRRERGCYNCGNKNHFIGECPKPKKNKAFVGGACSDSEDGNESQNNATCLMTIDSQENEELLKFSKDFSKSFEKLLQEKRMLEKEHSKLFSKVNELELEVKKLAKPKEVIEPCQKCGVLTQDVDSLWSNISMLQEEALNFSKFNKSSVVLDDMLSRQKLSQDREGLGFSKIKKITYISLNKPIKFVIEGQNEAS